MAVVLDRVPHSMRTQNPVIETLQMAILTSGKTNGTGVLFTRFTEIDKGAMISMWLPALRKIRRALSNMK
ncbi:MAG: hypothetical protein KZQ66_18930 [Candidatus Thiodiazotropha sp. (ex Lucinoma aequizonata)]|nr:hypothetical protein [Candidatus Thiodiazotropha sp. (ex Lucinoma aequizonata)]MCU7889835.1 hypothetical protein [Candidatus Thiodiazotropha sp. (ex Lucinoma aequizonata)]MCU7896562.1 hypothetical protein [Candidatus Thiodiazotropha sp. (ex Lucinoma aequizonata)]MCU7899582.1 hypothetical protein [Candidatus Thiodiazotropha sp. (ex Lucinoma aequizonata)]MCU7903794.1 hypothetical protein [Candidatus Thiodiazotropha sp. (ex Lucinoma aequizonata)]